MAVNYSEFIDSF